MRRANLLLAVGAAAVGVALPAASEASATADTVRQGGTLRVSLSFIDSVDPALAYFPTSWQILQATCAKLVNFPDKPPPQGLQVTPEVAAGYRLSNNRKVYSFRLRQGFRFNTGAKLTAASFRRAITRLLDPALQTPAEAAPGVQYARDIVGSDAVLAGKAASVSGVAAKGRTLVIRLKHPVPDFPARLAMPFFCAVPPNLPADPEGAGAYPSAGPYYIAEYLPGRKIVLRRNRRYHGQRPHRVDQIVVDLTPAPSEVVDQISSNAADYGRINSSVWSEQGSELVRKYGGKRLFLRSGLGLSYFVLNTRRPLFRNNARLRRAVNFALDRAVLAREQGFGVARSADHYLPPGFPGFRSVRIYPFTGNVKRARTLARGRLRSGKAVLYTLSDGLRVAQAQIVKRNLARIGVDVQIKAFPAPVLAQKVATPGEPFDIAFTFGWVADYSDPYAYLNVLLDGRQVGGPANHNYSYFDSARYNRLFDRASRLHGKARYRAYASLDVKLVRDAAPMAVYSVANEVTFVSKRVDKRCLVLRPDLDLAAACLK
jgi:peptide/nickel transport system substrate-binding protein